MSAASGFFFRAPITLPISLRDWAPDSWMASAISASSWAPSIPFGMYFSRMRISASFAATRSALAALLELGLGVGEVLHPLAQGPDDERVVDRLARSMEERWIAASAVRRAVEAAVSRAFTAVTMSARSCS
jgi:hypothetical protein